MVHERIRLNQILDLTILQDFLDDVAFLTGLKATLVDQQGQLFTAPGGSRDFCLLFSNNTMRNRCRNSDIHGCREAERLKRPYIYTCHAGLIDLVIPVILNDKFIGAIITGQIKLEGNDRAFKEFITLPKVQKYKNKLIAACLLTSFYPIQGVLIIKIRIIEFLLHNTGEVRLLFFYGA
jgi:ligand-binding sensor protein